MLLNKLDFCLQNQVYDHLLELVVEQVGSTPVISYDMVTESGSLKIKSTWPWIEL